MKPDVEQSISSPSQTPFLDTWKTSYGYSIFGLFAMAFINGIASVVVEQATSFGEIIFGLLLSIAYYVFAMWWAYKHSSLFGTFPEFRSNNAVSFLNLFCGGIIFGCLWNRALTNKSKGVSHIVYLVIAAIAVIYMAYQLYSVYSYANYYGLL